MRAILTFLAIASFTLAVPPGLTAQTLYLDATVRLDQQGDGTFELKSTFPAKGWQMWKQSFGDHPDLIWRNLKRQYAGYELSDYTLRKEDEKRAATARMHGRSLAVLQKDGSYAVPMPKPSRLISHSGHEWIFNLATPQAEQTTHILLPEGESNAQLVNKDSEDQQLVYRMPHQSPAGPFLLVPAISLAGVGMILLGVAFFVPKRKVVTATPLNDELPVRGIREQPALQSQSDRREKDSFSI